jgi:hypothetical protein
MIHNKLSYSNKIKKMIPSPSSVSVPVSVPVSQSPLIASFTSNPTQRPFERDEYLFERDEYLFERDVPIPKHPFEQQFEQFMSRVNIKLQEHNRVRAILIKQEKHLRILGRKQDQKARERHHVAERRITHGNHTQQLKQPDKRR